ncbi:ABC-type sugar transport system, periplasmic component [Moorella thermoacetica Y72]|uniref:ABC-type sugar transport system, periplasmic component n=1 Tax=Moorella thermoacetica Y72 TaxID=1325331 RepID=A0A0S6UIF3_NEOTH|nr:sugar ABC transporter substrate-binding protein [Moorella thermoacetica]GAF27326.1 ABC-type sugar transport system, periplasmic component [Moorella thermoacetica Y72]
MKRHSFKKTILLLLMSLLVLLVITACGSKGTTSGTSGSGTATATQNQSKKIRIGVTMSSIDKFLSYVVDAMQSYAKEQGIELTVVDARNDASTQLSQVENFIAKKMDAIVINPVDTEATKPVVDAAKKAGIPLIGVNRRMDGLTCYVGSDSYQSGQLLMEYLAWKAGYKGNVAIIEGTLGSEPARLRTQAIKDVIAKHPDMKIVADDTADFLRDKGMDLMENWIQAGKQFDIVASNNDEMAIGAIKALEAAGKLSKVLVGGIDATPDALQYLKEGKLAVTVYQNARDQGKRAIEMAIKAARGEKIPEEVIVPYETVKPEDADKYLAKWQ